ncbi:MAG: nitrate reductase [Anaerolineae bacterium]|nr:nitrate reductase [Anaerolineae bacterium]
MTPFITNGYGKLRRVLLCRPDYFELQPINEIANEFIRRGERPNPRRVQREHREFAAAIEATGAEIVWVEPQPAMPYQVFTRDVGVTTRDGVLLGCFFQPVRQGEEEATVRALEGDVPLWRRVKKADGVAFEGGDFMYLDERTAALGMGARTTRAGAECVRAIMAEIGVEVIPVPFDPQYLHIDMVFNVVGERVAVACLPVLPDGFVKLVRERGFELIEEPPRGVFRLNCNLLAVDDGVVISTASNTGVNSRLRALGFKVIEVDLHDLLMGGGGPHCMSFPIQREG